jgi:hypothetical protein
METDFGGRGGGPFSVFVYPYSPHAVLTSPSLAVTSLYTCPTYLTILSNSPPPSYDAHIISSKYLRCQPILQTFDSSRAEPTWVRLAATYIHPPSPPSPSSTTMLTSSPSPTIYPGASHGRTSSSTYLLRSHYDGRPNRSPTSASSLSRSQASNHPVPALPSAQKSASPSLTHSSNPEIKASTVASPALPAQQARPRMVDASTQYSPPDASQSTASVRIPTSNVAGLQIQDARPSATSPDAPVPPRITKGIMSSPAGQATDKQIGSSNSSISSAKRNAINQTVREDADGDENAAEDEQGSPKRPRKAEEVQIMPVRYERCNTRDLVVLISSMLMELIRYNDAIPLRDGHLTRFHSRAPPGISVQDYLQRLTTHATLSPPILLSMVYYIDRLCALYPSFTISSLTVHRFLITSATVASKGLSDSFWTNKTYARVGGVSLKELALLELEFLARVEWRIVPRPEVLVDYYRSLVEREPHFQMETQTGAVGKDTSPEPE